MRSLEEFCWFTRQMPAGASCVLLGRTRVYAGDWDGNLCAWSAEGDLLWQTQASDRVERMAGARDAEPPFIVATAGSDAVCCEAESGEQKWQQELGGSADLVACLDDGSRVVVTSSVFDMEYHDFIESTCWRFDSAGEVMREDSFDERPWHLLLDEEAIATMGLGRPRCGLMVQTDGDCNHIPLAHDDPILCGATNSDNTVFGHASGAVSALTDDGESVRQLTQGDDEGVQVLASDGELILAGGDDGIVHAILAEKVVWSAELNAPIDEICIGFPIAGSSTAWIATRSATSADLHVLSSSDGATILHLSGLPRIRSLTGRDDRICLGLQDGRVALIVAEMFERRLGDSEDGDFADEDASRKQSMKDKLRALRR